MMMKTRRVAWAALFLLGLILVMSWAPGAHAYQIFYSHYVFATGGDSPELDDDYLFDGPLNRYFSFTHVGEPLAPNQAAVNYFADIDAGTIGSYSSAAGGVTNFWPFGFTSTGRVETIGFEVEVSYLVPAGEYPAGITVGAAGRVTGSLSATFAAYATVQYGITLGAGEHVPPSVHIENDDSSTLHVDDPFLVTHQIVAPGAILSDPTIFPVTLRAYFANMETGNVRTGQSPDYVIGSAEDSFFGGLAFTEMTVPDGVTWTTDTGQFYTEEYTTGVEDTPRLTRLNGNYPNPFNPGTSISYFLADAGPVVLALFDLSGKRVRVLDEGMRGGGTHRKEWDGLDDQGRAVPSGIYLYTLEAGGFRETKKMMLVR